MQNLKTKQTSRSRRVPVLAKPLEEPRLWGVTPSHPGEDFWGSGSLDVFFSATLRTRGALCHFLFPLVQPCPGSIAVSRLRLGAWRPRSLGTRGLLHCSSGSRHRGPGGSPSSFRYRAGLPRPRARAAQGGAAVLEQDRTQRKVPSSPARSAAAGPGDLIQPLFALKV